MAKKKTNWYYILVLTNDGPIFVTSLDNTSRFAHWDKSESPMEMKKSTADDIALGLASNGYMALSVHTKFELTNQPYLYSKGHFEWKWDEKKGEK